MGGREAGGRERERQFKQAALQHAIGDRIFEFVAGSHASNLITSSFLNHETNRTAMKVLSFFQVKEIFKQFKLIILNQEREIEARVIQKYNLEGTAEDSKDSRVRIIK